VPRLFNANTFIRVEGADRFVDCREHFRGFLHFQSRIDLDQAAEDGLPFARVESWQFLKDFPYAHKFRLRQPISGGNDRFHPQITQIYTDSVLSWTLDVGR
jgi:hypothetical protein